MEDINDSSSSSIKNDTSSYSSSNSSFPIERRLEFKERPSHIGMKYYDPKVYIRYPYLLPFKSKSLKELTHLRLQYKTSITIIDISLVISNIISFSLHYAWMAKTIKNNYTPIDSSNHYLYTSFILSLISIGCIISRMLLQVQENKIIFLLNIYSYHKATEYYHLIVIESLIHLIQPYPWFKNMMWISYYNNYELRHSLNGYLLLFSLSRLYTLFRLLKKWSTFSNGRARRILSYYYAFNHYAFIFKAKLRDNDALFFACVIILFILLCGFIVNILECLVDKDSFYMSYLNSVWDLSLTILTISFNTEQTKNPVTNALKAVFSYFGLFFFTLLLVNFLSLIHLNPDEEKAYKVINIIKYKSQNGFIKKYLDEFIKYKAMKMRKSFDFHHFYLKKQAFLIIRKNILIKMKQCLNERYEIDDFVNGILTKSDSTMNINNNQFITELRVLERNFVDVKEQSEILREESRRIKIDANRIYNLAKIMANIGSFAKVKSLSNIKGKEMISSNEIAMSLREFLVKYKDRHENGNQVILNATFHNESSTDDENSDNLLSFYGSDDCE